MKRLSDHNLDLWTQHKRRKPLILRGARQVGKTYSVRALAKRHFQGDFIHLDFEQRLDIHTIFSGNLIPQEMIPKIEAISQHKITPGKTLLFLDEAQMCPRSIMSLRYFYEQVPELHVIATGSLLEFAFADIPMPVGRVQFLNIHPLNFREFLMALDCTYLTEQLHSHPKHMPIEAHQEMRKRLKDYFLVGGMPEAVNVFCEDHSYIDVQQVHFELIKTFRNDFSKYRPKVNPACLNNVWKASATQCGQITKYSHLSDGFSLPTIKKAYDTLCLANLLSKVSSAQATGLPLEAGVNYKKFKTILLDIGLMQSLCQLPMDQTIQENDLLNIYRGSLAEQFVGQELRSSLDQNLYFWSRDKKSSTAELDYLTEHDGKIIPIEVKSGSSGRLTSLHLCLKSHPNLPYGLIFSDRPYGQIDHEHLTFFPLYFAEAWKSRLWT